MFRIAQQASPSQRNVNKNSDRWAQRLDAAVLARSIQGVRAVKDELRLETAKR